MIRWYKLDNAAKVFPSVTSMKNSSVFRVSAVLKEKVDPDILQKAVDNIYDRFPILTVRLRRGVFWNYLDANKQKLLVEEERWYPCYPIHARLNNGYLIKIIYHKNRVSVEVFHSLTDGIGAIEFLKSLLYYYFIFSKKEIQPDGFILLADDDVKPSDNEDSFRDYYQQSKSKLGKNKDSYKIKGTSFESFGNNVVHGIVSASKLNEVARQKGGTITAYLTALLIYSIYQTRIKYDRSKRPAVVAIPVNLRKVFPSRTLRNFFGVVNIGAEVSKQTTFDALILKVNESLKDKTQKEYLQEIISGNVRLERYMAARFVPLFIKNIFVILGYNLLGENKKTISFSNCGNILLPQEMYDGIEYFESVLYSTPKSPINCSVCSVNDKLTITFTRTIEETDILKYFFSYLSGNAGLDVLIYSNSWGENNDKMQ